MPPFPFDLDPEDNVFDEVFAEPGQRSGLSQMQVEALRRAATEQVRRTAGSVTSSADFQDFLNQNGGAAGVLKSAAGNLFNQQLSKLKSIPGQLKPNKEKVNYLKGIAADAVNAIRGPLGYNNPTVAVGSPLAGQRINPEALSWIREQEKIKPVGYLDAMGGIVQANDYTRGRGNKEQNIIDIAFRNPAGYGKPSNIEKRIKEIEFIDPKKRTQQHKEILESLREDLVAAKGNPLMPKAIRYQLGRVIEDAPEGTLLQASPIDGAKGERARAYRMLSKGALETVPRIAPDYSRMPSEEEFRAARENERRGNVIGRGSISALNTDADLIRTTKTGPQEFVTATNKLVTWDPSGLKDPMIRAAFNLDEETDV